MDGIALLTITVLAVFVGFEVVSKVSSTLHTPLMSGANAIHGIILVGAIIVAGQAADGWTLALALLAVVLATANLVGGFVVTDRMLEMFRGRRTTRSATRSTGAGTPSTGSATHSTGSAASSTASGTRSPSRRALRQARAPRRDRSMTILSPPGPPSSTSSPPSASSSPCRA